ncbi:MAG: epoxyqueuosine reductase [Clostridia bacterium]|nr:epoxyqueuosine reductase [Clostridia bacterium]
MLTAEYIKHKAKELGATTCGIGDIAYYDGCDIQRDPKSILPAAKCIIGFGMKIPNALYDAMDRGVQYYNYTNLGVKYIDEAFVEILLLKMARIIEDAGYDACLQRTVPGLRIKGDKSTSPEVSQTYELIYSSPVEEGKPAPEVIIDYNKAAVVCGLGTIGLNNKVIAPKYGTYMRYAFIITDMPLQCDKPIENDLCDKCGECIKACPGNAISKDGINSWQCSVYYRGAHKSNPFMNDTFLANDPNREKILNGDMEFDSETAKEIYPKLKFLPNTHFGYVPCLCGKKCETVCYKHLKEAGKI